VLLMLSRLVTLVWRFLKDRGGVKYLLIINYSSHALARLVSRAINMTLKFALTIFNNKNVIFSSSETRID